MLNMNNLVEKLLSGIVGIGISAYLLDGVTFDGSFQTILLVGAVMGLLMFFVRPLLGLITLPLRIITLNLFGLVIAMALIWIIDILSMELNFSGITPLFWTTSIIWGISLFFPYKKK